MQAGSTSLPAFLFAEHFMSLYKQFATNTDLEKRGIYLDFGPNSKGQPTRFLVARAGGANSAYLKAMEHKVKPIKRQIQNETIELAQIERLTMEVYCQTVVLGWEGVEDAEGNPLPHSYENAVKLFTDLPDLFKDIQEQAAKSALFRQALLEADSGN
jgi:hypothetical protein